MQNKIQNWIKEILKIKGDIVLMHPKEIKNGDYAFVSSPENIEAHFEKLKKNKLEEIEKIEAVGRFINFYLSPKFFTDSVKEIVEKGEDFGGNDSLAGQKVMIEFTDANPFKEFHIGHIMSNTIGESVARVVESQGAEIKRANWQGDVGLHVATAVWGILDLGLDVDNATPNDLGSAYAHGSKRAKENEATKKEIGEINKHIFNRDDEKINYVYDTGRKISLDYFEIIYKRLGTKFDYYFFESKEGVEGKPVVEEFLKKGIFEKSDGAVIFPGEKYGLHTRVFLNSNNMPTYEAKELGLNKKKFEVEPELSKSIIVTGNEIKEYFKVLLKVISLIFPNIAEKTVHIPHGMLKLPSGKMSSRTGSVITGEFLIEQIREKVLEKIKEREFSAEEKDKIAEVVAIGAIKYSILHQSIGGDIIFDFEKSISFEGDSGPYLQYSYARANSVIEKAKKENILPDFVDLPAETFEVEKLLYRFPEIVSRAASEYEPHFIANYLIELARSFNSFYGNTIIVDPKDKTSAYKVALTFAFSFVMKKGLHLLGIVAPEKM